MSDASTKTILVVDDEEDVRLYLSDILEDAGFLVMRASDGEEALTCVQEQVPDLVSLDLVMPNKSGIRFLRELRRNPAWASVPVVVVTAHAHDDLGRNDFDSIFGGRSLSGPKCYLEKPVTPARYVQIVSDSLGVEPELEEEPREPPAQERLRAELGDLLDGADAGALAEAIRVLKSKR